MSVLVVGSVALDTIENRFGKVDDSVHEKNNQKRIQLELEVRKSLSFGSGSTRIASTYLRDLKTERINGNNKTKIQSGLLIPA